MKQYVIRLKGHLAAPLAKQLIQQHDLNASVEVLNDWEITPHGGNGDFDITNLYAVYTKDVNAAVLLKLQLTGHIHSAD